MRSRGADLETQRGVVHIKTHCSMDFVQGLEVEEGIGVFRHYRSMVRSSRVLGNMATLEGSNVVIAYTDEGKIVGYTVFGYPSRLERWGQIEDKLLYELGSVEVSRNWRGMGIARNMIEMGMDEDWLEDKVLFLTGFAWHWDTDSTGMTRLQYREYLMRLYGSFGFRHFHTNEPNIRLDLTNFLMARVGSRVSREDFDRFIGLCFDTDKDEL